MLALGGFVYVFGIPTLSSIGIGAAARDFHPPAVV
jgi:hypothetical protein